MDSSGRIYVEFAPELKARLNNLVGLRDILQAAGIDAAVEWDELPPTDPAESTKRPVETLRAAAIAVSLLAAVPLIESAITHYLDHQAVRDSHFEYWINEPLLDAKGRPILDARGAPRTVRRRISGFDEFPTISGGGLTITVSDQSLSLALGRDDAKGAPAPTKRSAD